MIESTPAERFARAPRPLDFVRIRLHRGGQVECIQAILEEARDDLFVELADLRGEGKPEDGDEVQDCAADIRHLNAALKDIYNGRVELVGPEDRRVSSDEQRP